MSATPAGVPTSTGSELRAALGSCRAAILGIAAFSGLINVLSLTGSLYMLEVYDRVLPGRSVSTLAGLTIIAAMLLAFQGALEIVRGRMLVRIGNQIDWRISDRIFDLVVRLPLRTRGGGDGLQPVRDVDTIRAVVSGSGLPALFDLPWLPFYLALLIGRCLRTTSPILASFPFDDKALCATLERDAPHQPRVPVRRALFRAHRRDKHAASGQPGIRRGASFHGNDGATSQALRRGPHCTSSAWPQAR